MRCPDCNKFVSYNEPEVELSFSDWSPVQEENSVQVSAEVHLVLTCGECSTELKETTFEFDDVVSLGYKHTEEDWEGLDVDFDEPEGDTKTEQYVTDAKTGKQKRVSRFPRTLYGAVFSCKIKIGDEEIDHQLSDYCQASSLDEMV